jgi:hypothetical protein
MCELVPQQEEGLAGNIPRHVSLEEPHYRRGQHRGLGCLQQPQDVQGVFVVKSALFSFGDPFRDFL